MRRKMLMLVVISGWLLGGGTETHACEATGGSSCGTSSGKSSTKTPRANKGGTPSTKRTTSPRVDSNRDEQFQGSGADEQFGTNSGFDLFNAIEAARRQEEIRLQNEIAIRNHQQLSQDQNEASERTAPEIDRGDFDTRQSRCPAGKGRCTVNNSVEKTYEKAFKSAKRALQAGQPIEATRQAFKGAKECAKCAVDGLLDGINKFNGADGQQRNNDYDQVFE